MNEGIFLSKYQSIYHFLSFDRLTRPFTFELFICYTYRIHDIHAIHEKNQKNFS